MTLEELTNIAIACRGLGLATLLIGLAIWSDARDAKRKRNQKLPRALASTGAIQRVL